MKRCPYCAEKIQNDATVCRYCGRELPKSAAPQKKEKKPWEKKKVLLSVGITLGVLLLSVGGYFWFKSASTPATLAPSSLPPAALSINFDDLPAGVPPDWQILYAPFDTGGQPPELIKANAQENHFVLENPGTYSGVYALYSGAVASPDFQISLDAVPDQGSAIGVFLVCRYSEAGWYQFRVSNGGSSIAWVQPQGEIYDVKVLAEGPGVFLDDGTHRFSGTCDHNELTLLADGTELLSTEADFLSSGSFGFGVESYDKPGSREAFDNLEVQFFVAEPAVISTPTATPTATSTPTVTSAPTATPTAAPTLRPTRIPTDELVLYQTDFENDDASLSQWRTFAYSFKSHSLGTEGYTVATNTSLYRFNATETNQRIFSIYDADLGTSDVDISLHATAFYSATNVGLVCRYTEAGWYQFMVEPKGIWSIRLVKYDDVGQLHFYKISSGGRWLGQTADLRAECKGDLLTFYINGEKQASLHDNTFTGGKVGMLGWSFDNLGEISMIGRFTIQRAQWSESTIPGPAPTPASDGTIYTTDFGNLDALSQYWYTFTRVEILGPGAERRTNYYINDFDPGTDVEISADLAAGFATRSLICRYSTDGWYEAGYGSGSAGQSIGLARIEHNENGELVTRWLMAKGVDAGPGSKLTLTCAGNRLMVSIDDQPYLYTEDNLWRSGRYGFSYINETLISPKVAFASYTVRPASFQSSDDLFTIVSDTPQEFVSDWMINIDTDPRVKVENNAILLVPAEVGVGIQSSTSVENSELTVDLEFLAESQISLQCRTDSPARIPFNIHSNGDWEILGPGQMANGNSTSIHPDQNQFIMRCIGNQLTLIANGETLATIELPTYVPAAGKTSLYVEANSQVMLNSLTLKVMRGSPALSFASSLPNQVSNPVYYQPGEAIYTWNSGDLFGKIGGTEKAWSIWYSDERPVEQNGEIVVSAQKANAIWMYQPELNDLPVEVSANIAFSGKSGGIGLRCRYTQVGRYEFVIQPDGSWSIRRNTSDYWAPRAANMTILAHGTSSAIQSGSNRITATCQGNELIFSANGTELGRVQDDLYPEGQAGIFFDKYTEGSFTNLTITRPE